MTDSSQQQAAPDTGNSRNPNGEENENSEEATGDSRNLYFVVRIKRKHVERLSANEDKIRSFFGVELEPVGGSGVCPIACYKVIPVKSEDSGRGAGDDSVAVTQQDRNSSSSCTNANDLAKRVQVS